MHCPKYFSLLMVLRKEHATQCSTLKLVRYFLEIAIQKNKQKKRDCNTCLYPPPSLLQLQHGLYPAPTIIIIMMRYFNKQAALLFIFLHAFFLTNQGGLHPN